MAQLKADAPQYGHAKAYDRRGHLQALWMLEAGWLYPPYSHDGLFFRNRTYYQADPRVDPLDYENVSRDLLIGGKLWKLVEELPNRSKPRHRAYKPNLPGLELVESVELRKWYVTDVAQGFPCDGVLHDTHELAVLHHLERAKKQAKVFRDYEHAVGRLAGIRPYVTDD